MYFPSVRKQIREQCGRMDEGLYFVSKVLTDKSVIVGISNGKLVTKEFWNGDTDKIVEFLNNYIKTGVWDTSHYFAVCSLINVFRADSEKEAREWCEKNGYTYKAELIFSNNFIQISI